MRKDYFIDYPCGTARSIAVRKFNVESALQSQHNVYVGM